MTCPQCKAEMSKKWHPEKWHPDAAKLTAGSAVVWGCGVCGCQLTQAEMNLSAKRRRSPFVPVQP